MRNAQSLIAAALCLSLSAQAHAQSNHCESLLGQGIFNRAATFGARHNLERLKYVFCSDKMATEESARSWAGQLKVDLKVVGLNLGGGASTQSYNDWRKHLCETADAERHHSELSSNTVMTASREILAAFNSCINSRGLIQYAETGANRGEFIWHFIYRPLDIKTTQAKITPNASPGISCRSTTLNSSITVGPNGHTLLCTRDICTPSTLVINADTNPFPPAITLNSDEPPPPPTVPAPSVLGPYKQEMKAPIEFSLPLGHTCVAQKSGAWYPHCLKPNVVLECVPLTIENGRAYSGQFDPGAYSDNCGACYYTFTCTPPTPEDHWKDHPCRRRADRDAYIPQRVK